jgi:CRISPR-associated protein Csm5
MADYAIYDVTVTTITPLHIGSGRELLNEYDYAIQKGRTWRINEDALLDAQDADDPRVAEQLARSRPVQLLKPLDYQEGSPFFRYSLRGAPRSTGEGAQLREQLKDAYDRPYLPGTTLKGALRTALGWYMWEARQLQPEGRNLNRKREFAARQYEQALFGKDPNHDLLRALQVSDSEPLGADRLMVANARVINRRGELKAPIEMEAIASESVFHLTVKIDRQLFSDWAKAGGLTLRGDKLLEQLPQVVSRHTQERVAREAVWFAKAEGGVRIAQFYQQLAQAKTSNRRFLIALGWGTGWEDKTFGTRLLASKPFMQHILTEYRLSRSRSRNQPERDVEIRFPSSRRVFVGLVQDERGQRREVPQAAPGWCLVEMKVR